MLARLSWRNLWRNPVRSLLTAGSVFFAVLPATFMGSLQTGSYNRMIENVAGIQTGYAQVHRAGYWDDPVLDKGFSPSEALEARLKALSGGAPPVPRLEAFALASGQGRVLGASVAGVDPERENHWSNLRGRVSKGSYWKGESRGALPAEGLARRLGLGVGDTVILLGQGYHGALAAGAFPVIGLVHFGSPELNERMLYLPLASARDLFRAEGLVTAYVLDLEGPRGLERKLEPVRRELGQGYEVMDWEEMIPELRQAIDADRAGAWIMIGVLYLIIAFGIFGTLFMMAYERRREFAVLHAVGMRRGLLARMVWIESAWLALLGVGAGLLAAWPLALWFHYHPIRFTGDSARAYEGFGIEPVLPTDLSPGLFFRHGAVVLALALCLGGVMAWRVRRRDPLAALRE